MAKVKLEYLVDLWVVGDSEQMAGNISPVRVAAPGSLLPGRLFSIGQVTLKAGLTKKDEFTLGQDGILNINLTGFNYYNNRESFFKGLRNMQMNINDFMVCYKWLWYVKGEGGTFTNAFINAIFRKTGTNSLWINRYWEFDYIK